jgi:hypothetical protein
MSSADATSSPSEIFTASDLDRKRRTVIAAARHGMARIRDTDGFGLVMLGEGHLQAVESAALWADNLHLVQLALKKSPEDRKARDFGTLTWARRLPDAQLAIFVEDMFEAVHSAIHDRSANPLHEAELEWKRRAGVAGRAEQLQALQRYGSDKATDAGHKPGDAADLIHRRREAAKSPAQ